MSHTRSAADSASPLRNTRSAPALRELLRGLQAMHDGDFTVRLPGHWTGLEGKIADTFNQIVASSGRIASELERVGTVVGKQGQTRQRVKFGSSNGAWGAMETSVNTLIDDLLWPTTAVTRALAAVAKGDLLQTVRLDVDGRPLEGEFLRSATIVNTMIRQLGVFTSEVTRVAREVGSDGKLGGQAEVRDVSGVWKELTDSVNSMASNLTAQVRNISEVTIAVANGDLSRKITVDVRGEILQLKEAINTMVDQLRSFASEVTRVAREVGTDGRLGGQAVVPGVAGTWKDLTDSVNAMARNLTDQVRNIAEVTTAVARGDLSRKITVDVEGEILELKNTVNTMVDQLNAFAAEVTRVAREVGTEGKLGGQAQVPGVAGTWKDLTDNVNFMASNLTAQVRNIAEVTTAVARGDLSRTITVDVEGEILELKNTINTMVEQLRSFAAEVTRVAREVGTDGRLGGQAVVPGVGGTWKDLTDNVNLLAANLTTQVRNIAEVTTAVARGDLSRKITVDVRGEILELKNTINTMVDQLNAFAAEVTRVAREVGTDGKLGGQAQVPGVAGTWKDLTDNVNVMAANLTEQVRGIVKVVTAVAHGDLTQSLTVKARGEVAALADTINDMTGTLATFAAQVTSVAREVGVEGRLGGQANVPGAAGTWDTLTGNVNLLAANLTTQVRAIAEVATAVTKGDLTRSIQVDARGEVAELKDNINTMIDNLRLTTERNREEDWLKTNLARINSLLQGQRNLSTVGQKLLGELVPLVNAHQGVIYQMDTDATPHLRLVASYAATHSRRFPERLSLGEGFVGQCAQDMRRILVTGVPADTIPVGSVFFEALPRNLVMFPVMFEGNTKAVIGLASLGEFSPTHLALVEQLTASVGIVLNSIEATMQTEGLLNQSQQLAEALQAQKRELQQTNEELAEKARELFEQNAEVERKNEQIEQAKQELEGKNAELARTAQYKSQFLANMTHELRTPLQSILILGQQLYNNAEGNLTVDQVEFAHTIHAAGTDLLNLINQILDLARIEHGILAVHPEDVSFTDLLDILGRTFRHEAQRRGLKFDMTLDPNLGPTIFTDSMRLQQVLKNLLSNAFKFTPEGGVQLKVARAAQGWTPDHPVLRHATGVVAFEVTDTGVGIPYASQRIIFEAFQQAHAGTSRKYGGTGLGLTIGRQSTTLLGGELQVRSTPGVGSTFTLYLPLRYTPIDDAAADGEGADERAGVAASVGAPMSTDARTGRRRRLLLVDANPAEQTSIKALLAHADLEIDALDNAESAPAAIAREQFDCVVLGFGACDVPDFDVLEQVARHPAAGQMPVVVFTGRELLGHEEARLNALAARVRLRIATSPERLLAHACECLQRPFSDLLPEQRQLLHRLHRPDEDLAGTIVLVVDDDGRSLFALSSVLERRTVTVLTAATGKDAIAVLESSPRVDVVLMDIMMPEMDGYETMRTIRRTPAFERLPIVAMTAKTMKGDRESCLEAGASDYLAKPVDEEQLLSTLRMWLHHEDLSAC